MKKDRMLIKEQRFKQMVEQNIERIQRICSYYSPTPEDRKETYGNAALVIPLTFFNPGIAPYLNRIGNFVTKPYK